jgi:hypothetical protein
VAKRGAEYCHAPAPTAGLHGEQDMGASLPLDDQQRHLHGSRSAIGASADRLAVAVRRTHDRNAFPRKRVSRAEAPPACAIESDQKVVHSGDS